MQNLENLDNFEILITQKLLKCPKDPFLRSALICKFKFLVICKNNDLTPIYEPWQKISNNVVCATSKGSDQPVHMRRLIRAFAGGLNNLWLLSYWLNKLWSF